MNPDQAIALGLFSERNLFARYLRATNHKLARKASEVVCMDSDMKLRLGSIENVTVIPPWPLDNLIGNTSRKTNPFILEHQLQDDFVFMYSGNHSLVHPLTTLLEAITNCNQEGAVKYVFIGGGRGKKAIEESASTSPDSKILSLPYQPLDQLKFSLSAADIHIVSFGPAMVGIVHPCKIYNALTLGKPVLFLGPATSALGQIVEKHNIGWCVEHGDVKGMIKLIRRLPTLDKKELDQMGAAAASVVAKLYSREKLCTKFCEVLEKITRKIE